MPNRPQTEFQLPQNQFSLNPVARPVDTFVTPGASHAAPNSDLIGLANALKEFEPQLNQVLDNRYEGAKQQDIIDAQAFAEKNKYENMKAFRDAVKAGKIGESSTPWYLTQLKAEIGRDQAVKAAASMRDQYDQSPVQFSDNVNDVAAFADKALSPVLEGADSWETAAMRPVLSQAKQSLLQQHVSKRAEERSQEREVAAKRDFQNALFSGLSGDDVKGLSSEDPAVRSASLDKVNTVKQQFKSMLSEKSKTVLGPKLEQWLVDTVASSSVAMKAPGMGHAVLDGLVSLNAKDDLGKSYSTQLAHADQAAHEAVLRDYSEQHELERLSDKHKYNSLIATALPKLDALLKDNPKATPTEIREAMKISYGDLSKTNPEVATQYSLMVEHFAKVQDEGLKDQRVAAGVRMFRDAVEQAKLGPISADQKLDMLKLFASIDSPDLYMHYEAAMDSINKESPVKTPDDVLTKFYEARENGTLTMAQVAEWMPQASHEDKRMFLETAFRDQFGSPHFAATIDNYLDRISEVGMTQYTDSQNLDEETRVRVEEGLKVGMNSARNELRSRLYDIEKQKIPQEQKDQLRDQALDQTLKNWFQVPSYEKFHADSIAKRQKKLEEKANPPKPPPQPMDKEVFQTGDNPDKAFAGITRDQTSVARWALFDAKPKPMPGDSEIHGMYQWAGWSAQKNMPQPVSDLAYAWGEDETTAEHTKPGQSGEVLRNGKNIVVPDLRLFYAREEMQHRDAVMQMMPDIQARTEYALKGWKDLTGQIVDRQKAGNPYITYAEKRQLVDDTNTGRMLSHYRKLFGYKPEELKELGPDSWKNYRMFMNSIDLEENGPKAIQVLGIKPQDWQSFRTAQKTLIERDIHDAQF